jgi:pantetheine-phosphate adenylyltransferase
MAIFIYPGTFSPPTFGHLEVVREFIDTMGPDEKMAIICSKNDDKANALFSPDECVELWNIYLKTIMDNENVYATTFDKFTKHKYDAKDIVMLRGIRSEDDFDYEKKTAYLNKNQFGITKYLFIMTDEKFSKISSSMVRDAIFNNNPTNFGDIIHPLILSKILEKKYNLKKLFIVTGLPGSGKSTILKHFTDQYKEAVYIPTDDINHKLRPLLEGHFKGEDLIKVAIEKTKEFNEVIGKPWLKMVYESLNKEDNKNKVVFLEIPYALHPDKQLYNFFGGQIIHFACSDTKARKRNSGRGTANLEVFYDYMNKSHFFFNAINNDLQINVIDTTKDISKSIKKLEDILKYVNRNKNN